MDYYDILGISRGAHEQDIKKAYRKLAMKWHPDKNTNNAAEAAEQFLLVAEAYDVLCDKERKAIYDQYGYDGLKNGVPDAEGDMRSGYAFNEDNATEIFKSFFGTDNPFTDFGFNDTTPFSSTLRTKGPKKNAPIEETLHCSLDEVFNSKTKKVTVTRSRIVNGELEPQEKTFNIKILSNFVHGKKVTYEGEGNESIDDDCPPGDVVLTISVKEHENFVREGNDLVYTAQIKLVDALANYVVEVLTLDGRKLSIPCNEVVSPTTIKAVPKEGFQASEEGGEPGQLKIRFDIKFPRHLTELQKKSIVKILT